MQAESMLITEVKSSLAQQGNSNGYPVAVDCDHGTIQLSGVVASADDARRRKAIKGAVRSPDPFQKIIKG
jgi:osmotically-inducible protein OsmY